MNFSGKTTENNELLVPKLVLLTDWLYTVFIKNSTFVFGHIFCDTLLDFFYIFQCSIMGYISFILSRR